MKRVLTAAVLLPIVIYAVLWANFWIFLAVLVTVAFLCYHEYSGIAASYGFGTPGVLGYGVGVLLLLWEHDAWLLFSAVALLSLVMAMRAADLGCALPRAALEVIGIFYVFGCWRYALPLRSESPHWLMYALVLNWAGDIGAYYVGRSLGEHKLAPRVSPQKTWEGAAASVVFSILIAGAYLLRFLPGVTLPEAAVLTAAANIAGQLGDLAESAMKRGAHVKDSGTILPGHGGFLDRVDSTLFALPVIYAYLRMGG